MDEWGVWGSYNQAMAPHSMLRTPPLKLRNNSPPPPADGPPSKAAVATPRVSSQNTESRSEQ